MRMIKFIVPRHHVWYNNDTPFTKLILKKVHSNALFGMEPILSMEFCTIRCSMMHPDVMKTLLTDKFRDGDQVEIPVEEIEGGVYAIALNDEDILDKIAMTGENRIRNFQEKYQNYLVGQSERSLYTKADMLKAFYGGINSRSLVITPETTAGEITKFTEEQFEIWLQVYLGAKQQSGENTL